MKIGMKKPSIKKSISARTTGRMKRSLRKSIDPTYGKKGMGFAKDPKKSAYNKLYNKTTFGIGDIASMTTSDHQSKDISEVEQKPKMAPEKAVKLYKFLVLPISILLLLLSILLKDWFFTIVALIIICAAIGGIKANSKKE